MENPKCSDISFLDYRAVHTEKRARAHPVDDVRTKWGPRQR